MGELVHLPRPAQFCACGWQLPAQIVFRTMGGVEIIVRTMGDCHAALGIRIVCPVCGARRLEFRHELVP